MLINPRCLRGHCRLMCLMWVICPDVSKALWPSLSREVTPSLTSIWLCCSLDDGLAVRVISRLNEFCFKFVERSQVTLSHKFCEMPHQDPSPTCNSFIPGVHELSSFFGTTKRNNADSLGQLWCICEPNWCIVCCTRVRLVLWRNGHRWLWVVGLLLVLELKRFAQLNRRTGKA